MQWIERIKKFIKPERESVVIENFDFPDSTHIFLIGFSYDIPTKQTFTWIENLLVKSTEQHKISRFHNHEFNKSDLFKLIKSKINRVEIFCGHGDFIEPVCN